MDDSLESVSDSVMPDAPMDDVRALILAAHPDVVPELIVGASVDAMLASVQPAREAYARIAATLNPREAPARQMPAGGGWRIAVDAEALPAGEKIRRGLAARQR